MKCSNEEEHKMKKTNIARLSALALTLCLASTALMSGTMAKYTTTVTGNGTATVAKWNFKANGDASTFNVNLTDTTLNGKVTEGKIVPGAKGSFNINLDASGSDTAVDYEIKFANTSNIPTNLKFYSNADYSTEINLTTTGKKGTIALADVGTSVTETIYWKWDYATSNGDTDDTTDAGKTMTFEITVTGTQADPTKTN